MPNNTATTLTLQDTFPVNGTYDWRLSGQNMSEEEWISYLQYVAALPGVDAIMMWEGIPAPASSAYDFKTPLLALMAGTGDFADT